MAVRKWCRASGRPVAGASYDSGKTNIRKVCCPYCLAKFKDDDLVYDGVVVFGRFPKHKITK
jgi:hypothetical protein